MSKISKKRTRGNGNQSAQWTETLQNYEYEEYDHRFVWRYRGRLMGEIVVQDEHRLAPSVQRFRDSIINWRAINERFSRIKRRRWLQERQTTISTAIACELIGLSDGAGQVPVHAAWGVFGLNRSAGQTTKCAARLRLWMADLRILRRHKVVPGDWLRMEGCGA